MPGMIPAYMFEFRTGWRSWCNLQDIDDCETDGQRHGWRYADDRNEGGGNRPRPGESRELDSDDVDTAESWRAH